MQDCELVSLPFYVYALCSSDKYSIELVANQMPPVPGLQGSDLACMLQLSNELNHICGYICVP